MVNTMSSLEGKKIGIFMESDYYEQEIWYYKLRFAEEKMDVRFFTRLWGQPSLTFTGHEYRVPFECEHSFEDMSDDELRSYAAIIVPSAMVADRLRYTDDIDRARRRMSSSRRSRTGRRDTTSRLCSSLRQFVEKQKL